MSRKKRRQKPNDEAALAKIIENVVERRRAGEVPRVEDYASAHPQLASVIGRRLEMIEMLESARPARSAPAAVAECDLATALGELPEEEQRLVYLRLVARTPWPEIAQQLGRGVETLRQEHASVVRRLIERCHEWLAGAGSERAKPAPW